MTNRWALLVGVNRYTDPNFGTLKYCVNDVLALEQTLTQLGYTVTCLHDNLDGNSPKFPNRDNVEARLIELCKAVQEDDLLWVHFACHGTRVERGNNKKEPVLITRDTQQTLLKKRALSVVEVEKIMRDSKARKLILTLDACHTGVDIGRDLTDPEFIKNVYELAEGFALIAASTAEQKAFELKEKQHGVFTYHLLQGLVNNVNSHGDFVTVNDLKNYVLNELRKWNVRESLTQEPTARTEGLGDIILADYRSYSKPELLEVGEVSSSDASRSQPVMRDDSNSTGFSRVKTLEKQELEEELANLTEQYTEVNKDHRLARDKRDRLIFKQQADDLLKQMQLVEQDLEELEKSENDYNQNYLTIQENLPEIDFCQAMNIFNCIITNYFKRSGGAACFLLENSYPMAGELLIYKIREQLKRKASSFKHISIDISTSNNYEESGLLASIGEYFNVCFDNCEKNNFLIEYIDEIIERITQSLQSGSIVFLEINKWNCLPDQSRILSWLIKDFWCKLVSKYQSVAKQKKLLRVKFIAVIDSEYQLSEECLELPLYCTQDSFDSQQILKLPLNIWQQEDIQEWLEYYSGLPEPKINFQATQIYNKTMNGVPRMVFNILKEEFSSL